MKCDYLDCSENGISMCMIPDVAGDIYDRNFCEKHLKKMLWDIKEAIFKE